MENTTNRAIRPMTNKGIKVDVKKVLYEQLYGESDLAAAEKDARRICWDFQGQEELVDYLYNLQMSFPTDYYDLLKSKELLPVHDWTYVLEVHYKTFDDMKCPICLQEYFDMVAPHMTFCGHIFCLPCILRHLMNSSLC
jgi:hypothetical protein